MVSIPVERVSSDSGYRDLAYARSFESLGQVRVLPRSGGCVLVRDVPGGNGADAAGAYPLFTCRDWAGLDGDVAELGPELIALSLVTDPFGDIDEARLRRTFPDRCVRFKEHYVVDLTAPDATSDHHHRNARRALRSVDVAVEHNPSRLLDEWCTLYDVLIARHAISGPQQFSRAIFERQLCVPGLQMLVARSAGEIVGMALWYEQDDVAYYHLAAYSAVGYELRAAFAVFSTALLYFRSRVRWLALGAGAGVGPADSTDGLTRFKRGWATGVRPTWFCGVILDRPRYQVLVEGCPSTNYFPIYRAQEFR